MDLTTMKEIITAALAEGRGAAEVAEEVVTAQEIINDLNRVSKQRHILAQQHETSLVALVESENKIKSRCLHQVKKHRGSRGSHSDVYESYTECAICGSTL